MAKAKKKTITKIKDLTPDPANVNKGSERGHFQLDWSLTELGAGRSILADADGVVLAGNKTLEVAADHGLPVRVVETDGRELVVVQRTDLRLNGEGKERERARQLAVADNRVSETSYTVDVETLLAHAQTTDLTALYRQDEIDSLIASIAPPIVDAANTDSQLSGMEYRVIVLCESETQQAELLERFESEGLKCQALIS